MEGRPKASVGKEGASGGKASAPHALDKGILLRSIGGGRPMADLGLREEVTKVMGHEGRPLVAGDNARDQDVRKAHE